ncbi:hypothetical protein HYH03_004310 [Edaphochlamys debaryana]|uniref:PsbP C-terminal domain-containing protein n=1 Tax=Edaphochlamys debaryana TaxID=47281 RepID=A0A835Y9F1_9CHLO|nr:hypothetical protein HYH03_004310 [Edaphochlamys debaryana]|eukprot:KAG2497564.1 hypothetical protein HYH03_004310 [Edaphochlamys debaryana]
MALATKLRVPQASAQRRAAPVAPRSRVSVVTRASASQSESASHMGRRDLFMAAAGVGMVTLSSGIALPVHAEGEYETFLGYATPPTSYGGYGGNANEKPRYTFEYPTGWKSETPNKVEKGTQGIDGRVVNPRAKDQRAFLVTLTRAGEDNKSFRLTDLDSTLNGFAGADYQLQDSLAASTNRTTSSRDIGGLTFYDYDIESPDYRYLVTITVADGKVFALFVRSPNKSFGANEAKLRHIIDTFRLI